MAKVSVFLRAIGVVIGIAYLGLLAAKRCSAAMDCTEKCYPFVVKDVSPCHCADEPSHD